MAKKAKKAAATREGDDVVQGDDHGKSVADQTKEARGGKEGKSPTEIEKNAPKGKATDEATKFLEEADPERQARGLRAEARAEFLRKNGIIPGNEGMGDEGGSTGKKVEKAKVKEKMYIGPVTCTSVHGQTHEKISAKIDLPAPSGEEYVWYAFRVHHPAAMREHFEIDPENKADPNLRSRYE